MMQESTLPNEEVPVRPQRPTAVTIISSVSIGVGVLLFMSGLSGVVPSEWLGLLDTGDIIPVPARIAFIAINVASQRLIFLPYVLILHAIVVIIAGIAFLKRQSWARTTIEILCWLGIAYSLAFATLMFVTLTAKPAMNQDQEMWRFIITVGELVSLTFSIALLGAGIWFLRGKKVRAAVR